MPNEKKQRKRRYPWFKLWSRDWRGDLALRSCSFAARGLWLDMLTMMHESQHRGFLLIEGMSPSDDQLARLLGADAVEVSGLLAELRDANVLSFTGDNDLPEDVAALVPLNMPMRVRLSRKMVRDEEQSAKGKKNGRRGGNPALTEHKGLTTEDKTQRIEERGQRLEDRDQTIEDRILADIPDASVPTGTGATAPSLKCSTTLAPQLNTLDPFAPHLGWLSERCGGDPRPLLGQWRKAFNDDSALLQALAGMKATNTQHPPSWMAKIIHNRANEQKPTKTLKIPGFDPITI
jgi:hypothetical protein